MVIVGDDQEEMFFNDNMPLFSIYWGESMRLIPRHTGESAPQIVRDSAWGYGDVEMDVPVDAELGFISSIIWSKPISMSATSDTRTRNTEEQ